MIPRPIDLRGDEADSSRSPVEHETKFVVRGARGTIVRRWLETCCPRNSEFPASIVSSIYFDTRSWRSLDEKINSDFAKLKVRLRWYTDFETGEPEEAVRLEAKFKAGRERGKLRVPIDLGGRALSRLDVNAAELPDVADLLRRHGVNLHDQLLPAFRIDYHRLRFTDPGTREALSLDYGIHVPWVNRRMVRRLDPRPLPVSVIELKGRSTDLTPALRPLVRLGCRRQSFSKYLECRRRLG